MLDEPLAALDSYLRWQIEPELGDILARFGGPAVWVSHDRGEIYRSCEQVCVLTEGRSAPVRGVKELMADPRTASAARLSGCENYVSVRPGREPWTVDVPEWGLTLAASWRTGVTTLGIRQVRLAGEGAEDTFFCRVLRVTEDVSFMRVTLRPEGAREDAPTLRMELDKEAWAALPDKTRVQVAVRAEDLLLLEE